MGNLYADFDVPSGNGSGTALDTTEYGKSRTITVKGTFTGSLAIEISLDAGTSWVQLVMFTGQDEKIVCIAANAMRVTRSGVDPQASGTPEVAIGSNDSGGEYAPLPVTVSDGTGAPVDVTALGTFHTIAVAGQFSGSLQVDISEDGVNYTQFAGFTGAGQKSGTFTAAFAKVERSGVTAAPGAPIVNIGAINDSSSGSGGLYSPPEKWGQNNVPQSQAATALKGTVSQLYNDIEAIVDGSVVGLSLRFDGTVTAGTATAVVTVNGTPTLNATVVVVSGTEAQAVFAKGDNSYVAGDLIGVTLTTDDAFEPDGSLACEAWLLLKDG